MALTPIHPPPLPKPRATYYRPGFAEISAEMGWKWLTIIPAMIAIAVLGAVPRLMATVLFLKLGWLMVALPAGLFAKAASEVVKKRREPFCIGCGYDLTSLPDNHHCPECGEAYTFSEINAYRQNPAIYAETMRLRQTQKRPHAPFNALPRKRPKSRDGAS